MVELDSTEVLELPYKSGKPFLLGSSGYLKSVNEYLEEFKLLWA